MKNIHGFKVVFIGMIEEVIPNQLPQVFWKNMAFEDVAESSKKWIAKAKEKKS